MSHDEPLPTKTAHSRSGGRWQRMDDCCSSAVSLRYCALPISFAPSLVTTSALVRLVKQSPLLSIIRSHPFSVDLSLGAILSNPARNPELRSTYESITRLAAAPRRANGTATLTVA